MKGQNIKVYSSFKCDTKIMRLETVTKTAWVIASLYDLYLGISTNVSEVYGGKEITLNWTAS